MSPLCTISNINLLVCRDDGGFYHLYEPFAIIAHAGEIKSTGESTGHYICDVKEKYSNSWFRTNDSNIPYQINDRDVTKDAYIVLYKNIET